MRCIYIPSIRTCSHASLSSNEEHVSPNITIFVGKKEMAIVLEAMLS